MFSIQQVATVSLVFQWSTCAADCSAFLTTTRTLATSLRRDARSWSARRGRCLSSNTFWHPSSHSMKSSPTVQGWHGRRRSHTYDRTRPRVACQTEITHLWSHKTQEWHGSRRSHTYDLSRPKGGKRRSHTYNRTKTPRACMGDTTVMYRCECAKKFNWRLVIIYIYFLHCECNYPNT